MYAAASTPVAVILSRCYGKPESQVELLVSVAVDGNAGHGTEGTAVWHPVEDPTTGRGHVIDTFLDLWHDHEESGMILYVSDATVRRLLQEQMASFPGLVVRDVIGGARLQQTWAACRRIHHEQEITREPKPVEKEPLPVLVVATDASRQYARKTTGVGAVTSGGKVRLSAVSAESVLAGEFAAVLMALRTWGECAQRLEVLTDSQQVCRQLNGSPDTRRGGRFESRCRERIRELQALGIDIRVSWVRGHNGHLLNTYADRAAVAARRCAQFGLGNRSSFATRLRSELSEVLVDAPVGSLLPHRAGMLVDPVS